jgi:cell division septum initiation protein DivIVA
VADLKTLVDSLIKENRSLKRQVDRLETKSTGLGDTSSARWLKTMARRLERALSESSTAIRTRGRSASAATRGRRTATAAKPRKPASPETQAKRLAALERARAARAAKKAQGS